MCWVKDMYTTHVRKNNRIDMAVGAIVAISTAALDYFNADFAMLDEVLVLIIKG